MVVYPREAEQVAGGVVVLEEGRTVHHGTFRELRDHSATRFCALLAEDLRGWQRGAAP